MKGRGRFRQGFVARVRADDSIGSAGKRQRGKLLGLGLSEFSSKLLSIYPQTCAAAQRTIQAPHQTGELENQNER